MKGINFTDFLRSSIFHFKRKVRISYILYYFSIYYLITFCRIIECTLDHSCPNFFFLDFVGGYFFKRNTLQKKEVYAWWNALLIASKFANILDFGICKPMYIYSFFILYYWLSHFIKYETLISEVWIYICGNTFVQIL